MAESSDVLEYVADSSHDSQLVSDVAASEAMPAASSAYEVFVDGNDSNESIDLIVDTSQNTHDILDCP